MSHTCPVCGYTSLPRPSHDERGGGSFDICRSCGTQFGYDDSTTPHEALRRRWIERGAPWWADHDAPPPSWDPVEQLRRAGHEEAARALDAERRVPSGRAAAG